MEGDIFSRGERGVIPTQVDGTPCQIPQRTIAVRPVIGRTIVGIPIALHADLIAIVDRGDAGIRHLPEDRQ